MKLFNFFDMQKNGHCVKGIAAGKIRITLR